MGDDIDLPHKRVIVEDVVAMTRRKYEQLMAERDELHRQVAELERQRDQVIAIVARQPIDARRAYADIRAVYGGGQ